MNQPANAFSCGTDWIVEQLRVHRGRSAGVPASELGELVSNAELQRERFCEAAAADPNIAALAAFGFTDTEMAMLVTLAAAEVRRDVADALNLVDPKCRLAAARDLVYGERLGLDAHHELSPHGSLRRFSVVELSSVHTSAEYVRVSPRLLAHLLGDDRLEPSLQGLLIRSEASSLTFCGATKPMEDVGALRTAAALVLVSGARHSGRRTMVQRGMGDGKTIAIASDRLGADVAMLRGSLRALALECRLTGKVPLLCNLDALDAERLAIVANEFAPLIEGNILVTCGLQRPNVQWDRPVVVIEMGQPTHAQRAQLWHESLGQGTAEDGERLAGQYPLAPGLIVRACEAAKARAAGRELEAKDVYAGIRAVLDERLGAYARRINVTQTWDDIVLPQDQIDSVIELMARVRGRHKVYETWGFGAKVGRGLGVSALFSGPPGTGKTMVAGLIAKELGLELYQVDMAKVVSKFIGETEKNLAALFDAAEAGHAILLFDEADSLFGKRTEVRSSNDRFANLETNYLLQRLESFTGVCLLTSNHESNMDPAFQRRLSLHLRFALPDADERAAMWQAVLPADAPLGGAIDFAGLGRRFAMSGGYIKNAALRAAFLAADRNEAITEALLERAARVEYEGMGKLAA